MRWHRNVELAWFGDGVCGRCEDGGRVRAGAPAMKQGLWRSDASFCYTRNILHTDWPSDPPPELVSPTTRSARALRLRSGTLRRKVRGKLVWRILRAERKDASDRRRELLRAPPASCKLPKRRSPASLRPLPPPSSTLPCPPPRLCWQQQKAQAGGERGAFEQLFEEAAAVGQRRPRPRLRRRLRIQASKARRLRRRRIARPLSYILR